jgi:hypothetical protein
MDPPGLLQHRQDKPAAGRGNLQHRVRFFPEAIRREKVIDVDQAVHEIKHALVG